jgi:2-succinyl-6-hydroxy-2,4-cyclohexadiene-1-carboxylate synthase
MPILALHGFTGRGSDFAPFAELCNAADWHSPDLPGHGPDPKLNCLPDATLRFVDETAATVCTGQATSPRVLLAYSMGARAGLLHAVNYPDYWDTLILVSGNPGIEDPTVRTDRMKADEALAQSLKRMGVAGFLDFWQETPLIRGQKNIPSASRETMLQNRQRHTVEGLASSLRQFGQGNCPNLWPQVGELPMPVCLITGAKDKKYTEIATRMSGRLPHPKSRHAVIDAASHMPHLEQAEATAKVVREFLSRL